MKTEKQVSCRPLRPWNAGYAAAASDKPHKGPMGAFLAKAVCWTCGVVALAAVASCGAPAPSETLSSYQDFPQTVELKGTPVSADTALIRYPFRIRVHAGRAVVMDLHGSDSFLHAFGLPGFRHQASFGRRGEGPEEQLSLENIRWVGDTLYALDSNKSELARFAFGPSDASPVRCSSVGLDKELLRALDFVPVGTSSFFIPDYSGDSRFCIVGRDGRLLRRFGSIPTVNEGALRDARPALAQAWRSFIDYNPRNGVLAAVTQLGEVVELWHLNDSTHTVLVGPGGEPQFRVHQGYGIPTGIMGFTDVQVTDKAVYAVFQGTSFKEMALSMQRGEELPDGGRYLYVFSLKGEPLCRYVLDRPVSGIAVDEERGVLLATDANSDNPVMEYRLDVE